MSNVNILRAVENIKGKTTVYSPLVEIVVNAIEAIEARGAGGSIAIRVHRGDQFEMDGSLPPITSVSIQDDGIGFTDAHRDSFDTLYSDLKLNVGGKGFGRFVCLKYFEDVRVESTYEGPDGFLTRSFRMGKAFDIIVEETLRPADVEAHRTVVTLERLKPGRELERTLEIVARNLVERLLPYFISEEYACPTITLSESDGSGLLTLNDYFSHDVEAGIRELVAPSQTFSLSANDETESFRVRLFKLYGPKNHKSRVSLVADRREVTSSTLYRFVPEFSEEFFEDGGPAAHLSRNYIVKAYVFGPYLDRHVSLDRSGFDFQADADIVYGIAQREIEKAAAGIAQAALGQDISTRQEKKRARVQNYVDEVAPWHKSLLEEIDLASVPYNPTDEDIEVHLQKEKLSREVAVKREVSRVLADTTMASLQKDVVQVVGRLSNTSKNDLIHYIALRKNLLDLFGKSLQVTDEGAYESEGVVHDIIFPRKSDSDRTSFENHNLWLIDERLNFTKWVSSDTPLNGAKSDRPDLLVYGHRILFRGDNEPSNPITIFEFKRPQRDDFVNPSSLEDPVQQIVRYVNAIRDGQYKTPEGRRMLVEQNTPFYGYVVCDITPKVERWLYQEKNFTPMPDKLGFFQWKGNINLYIEVLSWDKVLKDARMRNQIFFYKLGM